MALRPISAAMPYGDLALPLVFGPVVLVALAFTVRAVIGVLSVGREADADFAYRKDQNMLPARVDRATFVKTYKRVNGPRVSLHAAPALWGALLATPFIAIGLEFLLEQLWQATDRSRVFEPGYLVWQFFIFFSLMGAWAGIGWIAARRYHATAPGRFEDELRAALK
jgi:hypothetical protein